MSYLVCEKCNKYYELQEGELPADFDNNCECGSTLKFKGSLDQNEEDKFLKESDVGRKMETHIDVKGATFFSIKLVGKIFLIFVGLLTAIAFFPIGLLGLGFIIWWLFFNKKK
ncbi:hypothetical protein [Methanobacterium spitsbergense]|uniref:Uncharacterized protein n=1 Tax=Methanobacterium spitsbergense TaxID=2874285 RepID=A0A8T5UTH8_9EURY|nr:hypothetical protein [Methanobacterium spitsbergense]MBZ2167014.1 hypothetical protein [Methanobacterium spitsbergense]